MLEQGALWGVPRFYFHVCNGSGFTEDREGQELRDESAARKEAVRGLRDMTAAEMMRGEMNLGSFIEIEDENRNLLMTIEFDEAVRVSNERGRGRAT
jgi:hypothetical protein